MSGYPEIMDDVEALLADIYQSGEWYEEHEAILRRWRLSRGDAGMGGWEWYCGDVGEPEYNIGVPYPSTRDAAIRAGNQNMEAGQRFQIMEARCWNDEIEGYENCFFAETRNHEVILSMGPIAGDVT